ncbi:hypothetical protein DAKH74_047470 [Maudiozyma humilis]|uniref:BZIP domain-containing protein n=1 Tax=Maudiozyma humilis TaxID=51915 RepID=A0AAV5S3W5_MAUHU|nr:hypothetical protein DAKH74_047470 [Kazachstania humilis]
MHQELIPEFGDLQDVSEIAAVGDVFDDHFGAADALLLGPFASGVAKPASRAQVGSLRAFPAVGPAQAPPLRTPPSTLHTAPLALAVAEEKARKKAQNRAAQKAFRERKEARLRELQERLRQSDERARTLAREIDALKMMNMEIHTENQFLRQQVRESQVSAQGPSPPAESGTPPSPSLSNCNSAYSFPTADPFFKGLMADKYGRGICHAEPYPRNDTRPDTRVLSLNATWEYILRAAEAAGTDVDASEVMRRMKNAHVCGEEGPAFTVERVRETIRQVMRGEGEPGEPQGEPGEPADESSEPAREPLGERAGEAGESAAEAMAEAMAEKQDCIEI